MGMPLWPKSILKRRNLVYSTYLGGGSADSGQGIAVDLGGNAYVVGYTYSTNFPTFNPYQAKNAGGVDAFITKLSKGGSTFVFSTYLGGSGDDRGWAIAVDSDLNIYVAGSTLTPCTPASTTTTMCNPTADLSHYSWRLSDPQHFPVPGIFRCVRRQAQLSRHCLDLFHSVGRSLDGFAGGNSGRQFGGCLRYRIHPIE